MMRRTTFASYPPVEQCKQVPCICKLLHQHHLVGLLEGSIQLDHVLMAQAAVELDLTEDLCGV
jgi:hypothetical protein